METDDTTYCKTVLFVLGRPAKKQLLENSNLNNREIDILSLRIIEGLSAKECCMKLNLEEDTFYKAQRKAYAKLSFFLKNQTVIKEFAEKLQAFS